MRYRRLGYSGLLVSELSLGTWINFGTEIRLGGGKNILSLALEEGINFFDTADVYDIGNSEIFLGKNLSHLPRDDYILATKCFFPTSSGPNSKGLSRKHIVESVNRSLKRCGLDYIDLLQCHRFDLNTPLEETIATMDMLIRQGKILYWGVSRWTIEEVDSALSICKGSGYIMPISLQSYYNLFSINVKSELIVECQRRGLGFLAYSPLAQGVLTGKYSRGVPVGSRADCASSQKSMWDYTEEKIDKVKELSKLAGCRGMSTTQLALSWCLAETGVTSVICGVRTQEQLVENLGAMSFDLVPEDLSTIEDVFYRNVK